MNTLFEYDTSRNIVFSLGYHICHTYLNVNHGWQITFFSKSQPSSSIITCITIILDAFFMHKYMWCLNYTCFVVLKLHRLHSYLTTSCLIRVWLLLGSQSCCICISNLYNVNVSHEFLDYLGYAFVITLVTMKYFFLLSCSLF